MKYSGHYNDPAHGSFGITVDDETMTWVSNPPGRDLREAKQDVRLNKGGTPGAGKSFDLFPGGRAQLHK